MTIQMISWQLIVLYLHKSPFIAYVNFVIGITITQLTKIGLCMNSKGKIKTSGIECQGVDSFRILQKWGSLPCWVVALWHSTLKWHWTFQISCSSSNLQPSSTSAVCKGRYCDCQPRQYKDNHTKRQRKCILKVVMRGFNDSRPHELVRSTGSLNHFSTEADYITNYLRYVQSFRKQWLPARRAHSRAPRASDATSTRPTRLRFPRVPRKIEFWIPEIKIKLWTFFIFYIWSIFPV